MFIDISVSIIKFIKRIRTSSNCSHIHGKKCTFITASSSPFYPEMPIQILRAIFVAIKYYVFGLMAQKYSILKRGTSLLVSVQREIKINSGTCAGGGKGERVYGTCEGTFTIRLTHAEEAPKKHATKKGSLFYEVLKTRKHGCEYDLRTGSGRFVTYRCFVVAFFPLVAVPSPALAVYAQSEIRVCSFSFLVSHAYLEINKDNEIIYT